MVKHFDWYNVGLAQVIDETTYVAVITSINAISVCILQTFRTFWPYKASVATRATKLSTHSMAMVNEMYPVVEIKQVRVVLSSVCLRIRNELTKVPASHSLIKDTVSTNHTSKSNLAVPSSLWVVNKLAFNTKFGRQKMHTPCDLLAYKRALRNVKQSSSTPASVGSTKHLQSAPGGRKM